jgi:hypothetical protein
MRDYVPDHPDIESAMRTGYPSWNQPKSIYCCECGDSLDDQTVYEDRFHEYLCLDCLKVLHEKW